VKAMTVIMKIAITANVVLSVFLNIVFEN